MAAELSAGTAYIDILPNLKGFARNLAASLTGPQRAFQYAGRSLTHHLTLPILAAGGAAVKMSLDFDQALEKIAGLTGHTRQEVAKMGDEILDLAPKVQTGPQELANALYQIESSGVHGQEAMDALKASAKGAVSGLGDVATIADAVTSAVNAYGHENLTAAKAADILSATVKEGKGEAVAFAPALGELLPLSQRLGVSFDQVGASIASMTLIGETVPRAATALRGFYAALLSSTPKVKDAFKDVGLTLDGVRKELAEPGKGLPFVLRQLEEAFDGNIKKIRQAFPNIRGLTGLLDLTGKNLKSTEGIFSRMAHTTGQNDRAFRAISEGSGKTINDLLVNLKVDAIKLGHVLLPFVDQIVAKFSGWLSAFEQLEPHQQKMIGFAILALAALGPLLTIIGNLVLTVRLLAIAVQFAVTAFEAWETVYLFFLYNPITAPMALLGIAIAGVTAYMLAFRSETDEATEAVKRLTTATYDYLTASGKLNKTAEDLKDARLRVHAANLGVREAEHNLTSVQNDDKSTKLQLAQAKLQRDEAYRERERARKALRQATQDNSDAQRSVVATRKLANEALFDVRTKTAEKFNNFAATLEANGFGRDSKQFLDKTAVALNQFSDAVVKNAIALGGTKPQAQAARDAVVAFVKQTHQIPTQQKLTFLVETAIAKKKLADLEAVSVKTAANMAEKMGGTRTNIERARLGVEDFVKETGIIPDKKSLKIIVERALASRDIETLRAQVDDLTRTPHTIDFYIRTHGSLNAPTGLDKGTGSNARGTSYWRGGWSWVGEEGPELVNLPRGSKVLPHGASAGGSDLRGLRIEGRLLDGGYVDGRIVDVITDMSDSETQLRRMRR